jgi:hypothetical protein
MPTRPWSELDGDHVARDRALQLPLWLLRARMWRLHEHHDLCQIRAAMKQEGPLLEILTRRLSETPPDFLADPRVGDRGSVYTRALLNDLSRLHGASEVDPRVTQLAEPTTPARANRARLAQVLSWLFAEEWFLAAKWDVVGAALAVSRELAELVPAQKAVNDPERREELARLALGELGLRPAKESEAEAQDRLTTLSTAERARVLAASRAAEERARAIREALAKKAAEQSADKWSRE